VKDGSTGARFWFRDTVHGPSVADETLWDKYDAARSTLFVATQVGKPAPRYGVA
jgi:hypothetical protein